MTAPATRTTTGLGANYRRLFAAASVSNLGDGIGTVAYPWLASAVTRSPLLISLVVVVQRLPWLIFSLPAGVITDRYDRARIMVGSNLARAGLTTAVALVVLGRQGSLPGPDELESVAAGGDTDVGLYLMVVAATMLLGVGEVLYDNANQSFLPHIVEPRQLEKANGRLWSAEQIANSFVGPPVGAWLLVGVFSLPFFVDAATFAISAGLIAMISLPATAARRGATAATGATGPAVARPSWTADIKEGFLWLWRHEFLRSLAIILGVLNMLGTMSFAALVLFAQEELSTDPSEFAILTIGSAVGAVIGGWTASMISQRIGTGPSLWLTLVGGGVTSIVIGLTSSWVVVAVMFGIFMMLAVVWNVITVSLRQTIIPDELLGRVNSVYRFFAWGMMPLGALLGGGLIAAIDAIGSRSIALRSPWLVAGVAQLVLLAVAGPRLTTSRIEAARAGALSAD